MQMEQLRVQPTTFRSQVGYNALFITPPRYIILFLYPKSN